MENVRSVICLSRLHVDDNFLQTTEPNPFKPYRQKTRVTGLTALCNRCGSRIFVKGGGGVHQRSTNKQKVGSRRGSNLGPMLKSLHSGPKGGGSGHWSLMRRSLLLGPWVLFSGVPGY